MDDMKEPMPDMHEAGKDPEGGGGPTGSDIKLNLKQLPGLSHVQEGDELKFTVDRVEGDEIKLSFHPADKHPMSKEDMGDSAAAEKMPLNQLEQALPMGQR